MGTRARTSWLLAVVLAGGCTGAIDDDGVLGPPGSRRVDPPTVCTTPTPGAAPLRRVTEDQWRATVTDLFGAGSADGVPFPGAIYRRGYRTDAVLGEISRDGTVTLADAASSIAERVVPADLTSFLGCAPGAASDDACVLGWIDRLGARAYRRPLRDEERTLLRSLYADLRTTEGLTEAESVTGVVEAMLASPQFNYITSDVMNADGTALRLDDHEVAERLAYFLWNEPPDDALRAAADAGMLHAAADVEVQARRMVEDPRATAMLSGFVEDWLELHRVRGMTKDQASYPAWSAGLATSALTEHEAFVGAVMDGDARLATLLDADFAVVDAPLASLYGTTTTSGRATLPPNRRGILGLSAFLAGHAGSSESAPVVRGVTVMRQLFCEEMELPRGLAVTSPPQDPTRTTRERFTSHRADPACARCHDRIDPIGFAFEDFDAIGGHRTVDEHGHAIDATGHLANLDHTIDVDVDGGASVSDALAASPVVRDCFARQVVTYAEGRVLGATTADGTADDCAVSQIADRFRATDGDIRELLVAIVTNDMFLRRRTH